ncbi:uncharacterized protein LOC117111319 [Anneissia japonica]|uniref:uncharacterized protein LOC117111319 n=1 Tax=Anneissia japonica TaxID=1529436 RepID=UPI001425524D|nr:uncharacterized protein LOC117111319 [Anneissia japonica]
MQVEENLLNENKILALNEKINNYEDMLMEKCEQVTVLETKLLIAEKDLKYSCKKVRKLQTNVNKLTANLLAAKNDSKQYKDTNEYRKLKRRGKYLKEKENRINQKLAKFDTAHNIEKLNTNLKSAPSQLSMYRKRCKLYSNKKVQAMKELNRMKCQCVELETENVCMADGEMQTRRSETNGHSFTEDIEKCIMELVGELGCADKQMLYGH